MVPLAGSLRVKDIVGFGQGPSGRNLETGRNSKWITPGLMLLLLLESLFPAAEPWRHLGDR